MVLEKIKRPSKDRYHMNSAIQAKERATCNRLSVGAVLVRDDVEIARGYNGSPRNIAHCPNDNEHQLIATCRNVVHAELNAILNAAKHGQRTDGATLYVTHSPCVECAKAIINAGIVEVIWEKDYKLDVHALDLLSAAGVYLRRAPVE